MVETLAKANPDLVLNSIARVHRIGKHAGNRPVLVSFVNIYDKAAIFKNVETLMKNGLAISNDLLQEERDARKPLLAFFPALREKGFKPKIRDDKILIDGKLYSVEQMSEEFGIPITPAAPPSESGGEPVGMKAQQKPPFLLHPSALRDLAIPHLQGPGNSDSPFRRSKFTQRNNPYQRKGGKSNTTKEKDGPMEKFVTITKQVPSLITAPSPGENKG